MKVAVCFDLHSDDTAEYWSAYYTQKQREWPSVFDGAPLSYADPMEFYGNRGTEFPKANARVKDSSIDIMSGHLPFGNQKRILTRSCEAGRGNQQ